MAPSDDPDRPRTDRPDAGRSPARDDDAGAGGLSGARDRVRAETRRALRRLWLERLTQVLWPIWAVLAAFLGLALSGVFEIVSRPVHVAALVVFALGALGAMLWAARAFRRPTEAEARASLEAAEPDRPVAALDDSLAVGEGDSGARAVWAAHKLRMARRAGALRARPASLRMSSRDPLAFRLTAMVLLVFGLLAGAGQESGRVAGALDPGGAGGGAGVAAATVEAWATPPAYTGAGTIYLTERMGETVSLPEGTRISLRVYNVESRPELVQEVAGDGEAAAGTEPETGDGDGDGGAPAPELVPFGEGAWDLTLHATRSGRLALSGEDGMLAQWRIETAPDAPPEIGLAGPPEEAVGAADTGALQLDFEARDDHGVVAAWAVIEPDYARLAEGRGDLLPPPPSLEPIEIELPLPMTGAAQEVAETLIEDLTAHPWSGLPVTIELHAEDARGQRAEAARVQAVLPGRPFYEPMARAFLEERRALAWTLSNARGALQRLKAVTAYPEDYFEALAGPYLVARTAIRRLDYALDEDRAAQASESVMELLWQAAVMLEDGDLATAAERLRRAKERLSEALERGADEQEIARLMDEMRQAMNEYLQEMARQAMENLDQLEQQGEQRGRELTDRNLQEMLDEIERMAREGDRETAQQMLERMAQMLQNLQMQAQQGRQGQQGEGQSGMDQLNDMLRQQQDLADRSFDEMQRRQGQSGQSGRQGQGEQQGRRGQGGQPGDGRQGGRGGEQAERGQGPGSGMGEAAREQQALRRLLDELRDGLPGGLSPEAEENLGEAGEAMRGAEEALEGDDPGRALDEQVRAMDELREGARQLGEALRQQARGQGDRAGEGDPRASDQGRDPLGRPTSERGAMEGSDTDVPGQEALKRARELLDEIRRRSGDRTRPEVELDYLRRLLERF